MLEAMNMPGSSALFCWEQLTRKLSLPAASTRRSFCNWGIWGSPGDFDGFDGFDRFDDFDLTI